MIEIALAAIPSQTFTIQVDGSTYNFALKATNTGIMVATIVRDNVVLLSAERLVAGYPMIPYFYLEEGNFVLTTMNDDLPYYSQFGITQFLIYASIAEIAALRAGV